MRPSLPRPFLPRSSSLPLLPCTCHRSLATFAPLPPSEQARADRSAARWNAVFRLPPAAIRAQLDAFEPNESDEDLGPGVPESSRPAPSSQSHPAPPSRSHSDFSPFNSSHDPTADRPPQKWRPRTQVLRTKMSQRERAIAHDLLNDFPHLRHAEGLEGLDDFKSPSPVSSLPLEADVLPTESQSAQSEERTRESDLERELLDARFREIDSLQTDVDLVHWMNTRVFGLSPLHPTLPPPSVPVPTTSTALGQAFLLPHAATPLYTAGQLVAGQGVDAPLMQTTLYPAVLVHLIRRFRDSFSSPHLALHVFLLARSTNPLALTLPVFSEVAETKWRCFGDVQGVREVMEDMRGVGVEVAGGVRGVAEEVAREVLRDGIAAEVAAERQLEESQEEDKVTELIDRKRRYTRAERRATERIEEMVLRSLEREEQSQSRSRSPPSRPSLRKSLSSGAFSARPRPLHGSLSAFSTSTSTRRNFSCSSFASQSQSQPEQPLLKNTKSRRRMRKVYARERNRPTFDRATGMIVAYPHQSQPRRPGKKLERIDPEGTRVSETLARLPRRVGAQVPEGTDLGAVVRPAAEFVGDARPDGEAEEVRVIQAREGREKYRLGRGRNEHFPAGTDLRSFSRRADLRLLRPEERRPPNKEEVHLPPHLKMEVPDAGLEPREDAERMQMYAADSHRVFSDAAAEHFDFLTFRRLASQTKRLSPLQRKWKRAEVWFEGVKARKQAEEDMKRGVVRRPDVKVGRVMWELLMRKEKGYRDRGHPMLRWKKGYEEYERSRGRRPDA